MNPPSPAPALHRWPRPPAARVLGVYALAAWGLLLALPSAPATDTRDAGWQAILHYAAAHGWQNGVDAVFTYGPLGYLQFARQYHAETVVGGIVYQLLFKAFYVGLLVRFARRLPRDAATAFLLANTLLPLLDDDSIYFLAIGYGGLVLCGNGRTDRFWSLPTLVFLATAALMKETFLVYGGFVLACAAASLFAAGHRKTSALILGGFAACFFGASLWPGGQKPGNLPAFLHSGWEIVSGYPAAMAARPPNTEFLAGCVLVLGVVSWRVADAARSEWARRWPAFLVAGAGLFLAWKGGFTRSDPIHNITFFSYAVCLDAAVPVFFPNVERGRVSYAVPLLTAWVLFQYPLWIINERVPVGQRVAANVRWLLTPGRQHARLDALAREAAAVRALPRCRAAVGGATVDLFGGEQTVLTDGGYHYRPAPVYQPYSAYTPGLIALNAGFYRSERAPEFVLFKPDVIDDRYPTLEDAPVLTWLLRHYRPVLVENGFLLLQRKAEAVAADSPELLTAGELTVGATLPLPPTDGALWCEMDWQPTLLGRLVGLAFQPPYCELDVATAGSAVPTRYRIVPAMARAGFLLSPTVATPGDFLRVLAGRDGGQRPASVAIHPGGSFRHLMQPVVRCRLYRVPSFASPADAAQANALLSAVSP